MSKPVPPLAGATRQQAVLLVREQFRQAGVGEALEDARALLLAACKIDALGLLRDPAAPLTAVEADLLRDFAARRAAGEPPSRIVGSRSFWSVDLAVRVDVLDPRADTEAVVRLAKRMFRDGSPRKILDMGCGSGALVCALLTEYGQAFGVAVDASASACAATRDNLAQCCLADRGSVLQGDWGRALAGRFDLIVSNPPYIRSGDIPGLPVEVRDYDPHLALDGGADGLDAYRAIFAQAPALLAPGGALVVEFGSTQRREVEALALDFRLRLQDAEMDLGGRDRAVALKTP